MSGPAGRQDGSCSTLQDFVKGVVFGAASAATGEARSTFAVHIIVEVVQLVQVASLPLLLAASLADASTGAAEATTLREAASVLGFVSGVRIDETASPGLLPIAFAFFVAWTVSVVVFIVVTGRNGAPQFAARALRHLGMLTSTVLALPIASCFVRAISCPPRVAGWSEQGSCFKGTHAVVAVVGGLSLGAHGLMCILFQLIVVNREIWSSSVNRKASGRVEALLTSAKLVFAVLFNVGALSSVVGLGTVLLLGYAATWVFLFLTRRPYFDARTNLVHTASAAAFAWTTLWLLLCILDPAQRDSVLTLIMGVAVAAVAGGHAAREMHASIVNAPLASLRGLHNLQTWIVHKAGLVQAAGTGSVEAAATLVQTRAIAANLARLVRESSGGSYILPQSGGVDAGLASENGDSMDLGSDYAVGGGRAGGSSGRERRAALVLMLERTAAGVDAAQGALVEGGMLLVQRGGRMVLQHHARQPHAWLFVSLLQAVSLSPYLELLMLHHAQRAGSALDTRFFVYHRARQLQRGAEGGESRSGATLANHAMFDQYRVEASQLQRTVFEVQTNFWQALDAAVPDMKDLNRLGSELQVLVRRLGELYRVMLATKPNALDVLKEYIAFLREVTNDGERAEEMVRRVQKLEQDPAGGRLKVPNFVAGRLAPAPLSMDANMATVLFNGSTARLGEIVELSPSACTLFGLEHSSEVAGEHVSVLFPRILRPAVNRMLVEASESGTHVGTQWTYLAARRNTGTLFPCTATLRDGPPPTAGGEPRLLLAIEPTETGDHVMLLGGEGDHLYIDSACNASQATLNLGQLVGRPGNGAAAAAASGLAGSDSRRGGAMALNVVPALKATYASLKRVPLPSAASMADGGPSRNRGGSLPGTGQDSAIAMRSLRELSPGTPNLVSIYPRRSRRNLWAVARMRYLHPPFAQTSVVVLTWQQVAEADIARGVAQVVSARQRGGGGSIASGEGERAERAGWSDLPPPHRVDPAKVHRLPASVVGVGEVNEDDPQTPSVALHQLSRTPVSTAASANPGSGIHRRRGSTWARPGSPGLASLGGKRVAAAVDAGAPASPAPHGPLWVACDSAAAAVATLASFSYVQDDVSELGDGASSRQVDSVSVASSASAEGRSLICGAGESSVRGDLSSLAVRRLDSGDLSDALPDEGESGRRGPRNQPGAAKDTPQDEGRREAKSGARFATVGGAAAAKASPAGMPSPLVPHVVGMAQEGRRLGSAALEGPDHRDEKAGSGVEEGEGGAQAAESHASETKGRAGEEGGSAVPRDSTAGGGDAGGGGGGDGGGEGGGSLAGKVNSTMGAKFGRRAASWKAAAKGARSASSKGDFGENRSYQSSVSRASQALTREMLRAKITRQRGSLEVEVRRMRIVLLVIVAMCVGLAVGGVGFTEVTAGMMEQRLAAYFACTDREVDARRTHRAVHWQLQFAAGRAMPGLAYAGRHAQAGTAVERYRAAHAQSLRLNRGIGGVSRAVEVQELLSLAQETDIAGSPELYRQPLADAVLSQVAAVRNLLRETDGSPGSWLGGTASLEAATYEGNFDTVHQAVQDAAGAIQADVTQFSDLVMLLQLVLMSFGFVAIIAGATVSFLKEVRSLTNRMRTIQRVFLLVPPHVVTFLKNAARLSHRRRLGIGGGGEDEAGAGGQSVAQSGKQSTVDDAGGAGATSLDELDRPAWLRLVYGHLRENKAAPGGRGRGPGKPRRGEAPLSALPSSRSMEAARPHRDSSRFVVRSVLRLMTPLVVVAGWITFMYVYHRGEAESLLAATARQTLLTSAEARLFAASRKVLGLCPAGSARSVSPSATAAAVSGLLVSADEDLAAVDAMIAIVRFGGRVPATSTRFTPGLVLGAYEDGDPLSEAVVTNMCSAADGTAACLTAHSGAFAGVGLYGAVSGIVSSMRAGLLALNASAGEAGVCAQSLSVGLPDIVAREDPHVRAAFEALRVAWHSTLATAQRSLRTNTLISCAMFAVGFTLYSLLLYWPLIRRMSETLHNVRALLLIVPARVLELGFVRRAIRDVILDDGTDVSKQLAKERGE